MPCATVSATVNSHTAMPYVASNNCVMVTQLVAAEGLYIYMYVSVLFSELGPYHFLSGSSIIGNFLLLLGTVIVIESGNTPEHEHSIAVLIAGM